MKKSVLQAGAKITHSLVTLIVMPKIPRMKGIRQKRPYPSILRLQGVPDIFRDGIKPKFSRTETYVGKRLCLPHFSRRSMRDDIKSPFRIINIHVPSIRFSALIYRSHYKDTIL